MRIAVATTDGKVVTKHFGNTPKFAILEVDEQTWTWHFVEWRVNSAACQEGFHDAAFFTKTMEVIHDCGSVFVSKVGPKGRRVLEREGFQILETAGFIEELMEKYIVFLKRKYRGPASSEPAEAPRHRDVMNDHPCFSAGDRSGKGRLHLPVSKACNIQCRFCNRTFNSHEERPGVASGILPVEEVLTTVDKALSLCPELTVIGIAGPGDTLASDHAIETFKIIDEAHPALIKCLSTNGLALPGKAQALYDVGVRSLTVTVNAVDPAIACKVVDHIVYEGKVLRGEEAGRILVAHQLQGIREAADIGIVIKANTVLIPGINSDHIEAIAKAVSEAGASMHNIIPLIPQHEMADIPAPSCEELGAARKAAEKYLTPFMHCQHCRADACGVPGGKDYAGELYGIRVAETFSHG